MRQLLSLFAVAGCVITQAALGYTGTYYIHLGDRSREEFCNQILDVYKHNTQIASIPGKCIWLEGEQEFGMYHTLEQTTIQFRLIHGKVYEVVYDLPASVDEYDFSSFLARAGKEELKDIGITMDGYSGKIAKARKAREQALIALHNLDGPKCKEIKFTGYGAIYPHNLAQIYQSNNPEELLAYNPMTCTYKEWGGRYLEGGGVINRNRMTECKGIAVFNEKRAKVVDWTKEFFRIETEIDFNTGRRPLSLFIRRKDAHCVN